MTKHWGKWVAVAWIGLALYVAFSGLPAMNEASSALPNVHAGHDMGGTAKPAAVQPVALPPDMNDPYLDPVALQMNHAHAAAAAQTEEERRVAVDWSWPKGNPAAGQSALLLLAVTDGNGRPVSDYMVANEKLMHLIVVRDDLELFRHLHPVHRGNGVFEVMVPFEEAGRYSLYADFMPEGLSELTRRGSVWVTDAAGEPAEGSVDPETGTAAGNSSPAAELTPSRSLSQSIGGVEVTLHYEHLMAGMHAGLTFSFRDESTGKPVGDLEPYLGSVGHVVAIDESREQYIHVHPLNWASSGPLAAFGVMFPTNGFYKIWGQFQRNGETFIVPFVIEVP